MAIETWNPGRWGTSDFKWQGWLNGGTNPKKSLEQNLTPEIPCWITEQQKFPESIHWYNMKNINIRFEYPQKSLLKSSYPEKNTCQNFPTQNNLEIENFNPPRIFQSSLSLEI